MNYSNIYTQLINKAKSRNLSKQDCYIERHHVIPHSEGGTDDESNLVNLTAREHYIAHLLLAKIYNDAAMHSAVIFMQTNNIKYRTFKFNSHLYAKLRIEFGKKTSKDQKGKQVGKNNPMYGKSIFDFMSEEKIVEWRKNHLVACRKRRGLPSNMKGKHHTDKAKKQISENMKGFYWWNNGVVAVRSFECPGKDFKRGRLKLTEEWKNKIRASAPKGENHPWYGKHHTDEAKKKISASKKRRKLSK